MTRWVFWILCAVPAAAQNGFPFQSESLTYAVNWPGGVSLGEGRMNARQNGGQWEFSLTVDASLPVLAVTDRFRSVAADFCSVEFEKDSVHGPRKTQETTQFDAGAGRARRITRNGGSSEMTVESCPRDALAFLFLTRREMGQGRVPQPQTIYFGSPYQIRLEYTGAQTVAAGGRSEIADRVVASVNGKASAHTFELFFARDAARTPLIIRVPFPAGTFSMELVR